MMPREIAILDAYMPTVVLMFVLGALATWAVDRVLAYTGLYRHVWHAALFDFAIYICLVASLAFASKEFFS